MKYRISETTWQMINMVKNGIDVSWRIWSKFNINQNVLGTYLTGEILRWLDEGLKND